MKGSPASTGALTPPERRIRRAVMAEKQGKGSAAAKRANAKAHKEGTKNPRKSSAAQAELGKKGAKAKKT